MLHVAFLLWFIVSYEHCLALYGFMKEGALLLHDLNYGL